MNLNKSSLVPSQTMVYLGIKIESQTFRALPTPLRIEKFFSIAEEFLYSKVQSAKFWRVLLGHLVSLMQLGLGSLGPPFSGRSSLVLRKGSSRGGCFSVRSLSRPNVLVRRVRPGLGRYRRGAVHVWSLVGGRIASLCQPSGVVGGTERSSCISGPSARESSPCILGQHHNSVLPSASGGTFSPVFNEVSTVSSLGRAEGDLHSSSVCPRSGQCGSGCSVPPQSGDRGGMDSAPGGLRLASQEVAGDDRSFCVLSESPLWCLFCAGVGSHGCGYGCHAPAMGFSSGVRLSSIRHDSSGSGEAEVIARHGSHSYSALLAAEAVVSKSSQSSSGAPSASSGQVGSFAATTRSEVPPKPPRASASYLATIKRFARASGFSAKVAGRLGHSRRPSSVANYQSNWAVYRCWCADTGHSVSNLTVSKAAYFLLWLWEVKKLSVSLIKAHHSILSAVFCFKLPELSDHHVLRDLIRSFAIERPRRPQVPPPWDLDVVLRHLMSKAFEPLESLSLKSLTKKALFFVALATAKRVVSFRHTLALFPQSGVTYLCPTFLTLLPRRSTLMLRCLVPFVCALFEISPGIWRRVLSFVRCWHFVRIWSELGLWLHVPRPCSFLIILRLCLFRRTLCLTSLGKLFLMLGLSRDTKALP